MQKLEILTDLRMYLRYAACGDPRSAGVSAVYLQPGAGGVHLAAQLADVSLPGSLQLTEELGHRLINMQLTETSEIYLVIVKYLQRHSWELCLKA